jgi:hypothetical protein
MQKLNRWTRALAFFPLFAAVSMLAACGDDPVEPEDPAEAIESMQLTIGANTVTLNTSGAVVSGTTPIVIPAGTHAVSATFLDGSGASINSELGEFEMRLTPASTALLTFARTGAFTGTVTRVAAGSTTLDFVLWHIAEGHEDLGPFPVAVTVQ